MSRDQAAELRRRKRRDRKAAEAPHPPVVVVGSGKGGVGKSVLALALGASLARRGRRTLVLDGAQNQGNLHVLLDVARSGELAGVLPGERAPHELVQAIGERLWLLPAASGEESLYALTATERSRLHHRLTTLYDDYDAVVVDAGPGLDAAVRVSALRASRLALVANPEPASLSDAYALAKMVHAQAPWLPIAVWANRADEAEGAAVHERLDLAARRFLRRELGYLGAVPECAKWRAWSRHPGSAPFDLLAGEAGRAVESACDRLLQSAAPAAAAA